MPCKAGAKLSFRLVPDQDPKTVSAQFREHVRSVCPPGVTYEVIDHHGAPAVLVGVDSPGVRAAVVPIEAGFGKTPVFIREGGSIPVVGLFKTKLGVDTLLLGWGQNDDNLHGPNEKFSLADFHRGVKASAVFDGGAGQRGVTLPQSFVSLNYHLIFSTKDREPTLADEVRPRLFEYVGGILKAEGSRLLAAGGMPDHSHWLVSLHQRIAVADALKIIKSCSSKWVHEAFPRHRGFAWQAGYGAFAVSYSNLSKVEAYIRGQADHHRITTYQEEFLAFLKRHKIPYDERYLWE